MTEEFLNETLWLQLTSEWYKSAQKFSKRTQCEVLRILSSAWESSILSNIAIWLFLQRDRKVQPLATWKLS